MFDVSMIFSLRGSTTDAEEKETGERDPPSDEDKGAA
jgi:hypothetical protein